MSTTNRTTRIRLALVLAASGFLSAVAIAGPVRFAVIGDFGDDSGPNGTEGRVARMIRNWNPDFILTVGDNAYSDHNAQHDAFAHDVVSYYGEYIQGSQADPDGSKTRFFPVLGNHDYRMSGSGIFPPRFRAYERTFAVPAGPGGHHYYQFARGPVRFFALDSNRIKDWNDPKIGSAQETWFRQAVGTAQERWKIAYFHHTPYVSGSEHGDETWMRDWKFETSSLTAVLAGHEHVYERVMVGQFPFFTNGLGGAGIYKFAKPLVTGSEVHWPDPFPPASQRKHFHGAIFVEASDAAITFEFWNLKGEKIDHWPAGAPPLNPPPAAVP